MRNAHLGHLAEGLSRLSNANQHGGYKRSYLSRLGVNVLPHGYLGFASWSEMLESRPLGALTLHGTVLLRVLTVISPFLVCVARSLVDDGATARLDVYV